MGLAPIALFTYKRPTHTSLTINALAQNGLASESDLYIFCDGPKGNATAADILDIQKVRKLANETKGFKSVQVISRAANQGLGPSIIQGVTEILSQFPTVIVVEDDLITTPGFLSYMNDALVRFESQEQVMHVSAYMFPISATLPDHFFLRIGTCWGWATWSRAWKHFNGDLVDISKKLSDGNMWSRFDFEGTQQFSKQIELNLAGKMNTWAVRWYASIFLKDGLSLHPGKSFVQNIGFDNTGENCEISTFFDVSEYSLQALPISSELRIEEDESVRAKLRLFYDPHFGSVSKPVGQTTSRSYFRKVLSRLRSLIR